MYTVKLPLILQPFFCPDLTRLGKNHDGGYLIDHHSIDNTKTLVSLGVDNDWSFEKQFLEINDCDFVAYDSNVDVNQSQYQNFFVDRKQHKKINVGYGVGNITPKEIFENISTPCFLKCDIEGNEYAILRDLIGFSRWCSGMVMEFHDINVNDNFNKLTDFIGKITPKLVHIHVNNYMYYKKSGQVIPDVLELSFSSNPNVTVVDQIDLPNGLDMPNNVNDQEFRIVF